MKQAEYNMKWEKRAPDCTGYWLRINAIGKPQVHYVFEIDNVLVIEWGWSGDTESMRIDNKIVISKLEYFFWAPLLIPSDLNGYGRKHISVKK